MCPSPLAPHRCQFCLIINGFAHILQSEAWRLSEGVLVGFIGFDAPTASPLCITRSTTVFDVFVETFFSDIWEKTDFVSGISRKKFNRRRYWELNLPFLKVKGSPTCQAKWVFLNIK